MEYVLRSPSYGVIYLAAFFVLREYVLMLVNSTTENILTYKVIDIIQFVKHFLNSTTDTQS